jgi:hypothetical protein
MPKYSIVISPEMNAFALVLNGVATDLGGRATSREAVVVSVMLVELFLSATA